jgi:acyl carrier protein
MTLSTADRVRSIIQEQLGVDEAPDVADVILDLRADSLDQVALVLALEDAFGIEIPNSAMEAPGTVGDVIALVEGLTGETQPPERTQT